MKKTNIFKIAALTAVFAVASMFANAQYTNPDGTITTQSPVELGEAGGYVKVIDNKGTVKYIQTVNGLTTFTNENPTNGAIVTTFQLGGTLTDDTYIDATGQEFGIYGLDQLDSTGAVGYQLVIVDPTDGKLKRLPFESFIRSGMSKFTVSATPFPVTQYQYTISPAVTLPVFSQVYVYRNGAKLIANEDYKLFGTGGFEIQNTVTLYPEDVIEIHYIK